jgi:cysteinyl-tRNA synthetase
MSKSRGNVTYVEDLLDKGFYPHHIRFYLLYGPYRDDLNLRLKHIEDRAGYLDRIRQLVDLLLNRETEDVEENDLDPAAEMRIDFENHMNNNLNYAGAFDAVADHLFRAVDTDRTFGIPNKSRQKLGVMLADADRIFGVLGCD